MAGKVKNYVRWWWNVGWSALERMLLDALLMNLWRMTRMLLIKSRMRKLKSSDIDEFHKKWLAETEAILNARKLQVQKLYEM